MEEHAPTSSDILITWLREKYADGDVVKWYTDSEPLDNTFSGWVDVCLPGMEELHFNWVWSIDSVETDDDNEFEDPVEEEQYEEDIFTVEVEPDKEIHFTEGVEPGEIRAVATSPGEVPSESQVFELYENNIDAQVETVPAWSVPVINQALSNWSLEYLGKILTFELDEDVELLSPLARKALEALEAYERGDTPGYDLGDGVIASSETMDYLLSLDPDVSAQLTAEIKEAIQGG